MKRAILILGLILISTPCFAGTRRVVTTTVTPPAQLNSYNDQIQMAKDLNNIEMNMFGQTYYGQSLNSRLNRLEQSAFNRTFPTSTFRQRMDNLMTYNKYPVRSYQGAMPPSQTIKQSLIDRVRMNLTGAATGFTPPIGYGYYNNGSYIPNSSGYYNTNPYYNSSPFGNSRYYTGNRGWAYNNYGIQSGTGVHIID